MEKIYLIQTKSCLFICKSFYQYSFEKDRELYSYTDSILLLKKVNRQEAKILYTQIQSSNMCDGKPVKVTELK